MPVGMPVGMPVEKLVVRPHVVRCYNWPKMCTVAFINHCADQLDQYVLYRLGHSHLPIQTDQKYQFHELVIIICILIRYHSIASKGMCCAFFLFIIGCVTVRSYGVVSIGVSVRTPIKT